MGDAVTTDDLRPQISAIQTTLRHIEAGLKDDRAESKKRSDMLDDLRDRITRVETVAQGGQGLPERVAHNETANAVQDAVNARTQELTEAFRRDLRGGLQAIAALISIGAAFIGVVVYFTGG